MAGKGFTFKQFEINHEACAMKVGTDGILLGRGVRVARHDALPTSVRAQA